MKVRLSAAAVPLAIAVLPCAALAQPAGPESPRTDTPPAPAIEAPPPEPTPEEQEALRMREMARLRITPRFFAEHTFNASLDDLPIDVSITRGGAGVSFAAPLSRQLRFSLGIDGEISNYDFDDVFDIIETIGNPFSETYRATIRPQLLIVQSPQSQWFVGGIAQASGTFDADFGDTITGGGFVGFRHQVSENFALSIGGGLTTRLEDDPLFIPIIGLEWKTGKGISITSEGLGLTLNAGVTDDVSFILSGGFELREFRLEDDNPAPQGVLRDSRALLGVGFQWRPSPSVAIELMGGAVVWQEFEIDDQDGNELAELNTDPTPFVRIGGRITF